LTKKINQIIFYFVEEGSGRGSEYIKKECNVNCFDFFFFSAFFMGAMDRKSQLTQKNCTKIEKEGTYAHRKELEAH